MGAPAIFEKQIEIKLLHSASTEEVTDSGNHLERAGLCINANRHSTPRIENKVADFNMPGSLQ
jgi:hypothetical protein